MSKNDDLAMLQQHFCVNHYVQHGAEQRRQEREYSTRHDSSWDMRVDDEQFQEMLNNLYEQVNFAYGVPPGMFERAEKAAKATAERMRQQEEEARERIRKEQERWQREWFQQFGNATQQQPKPPQTISEAFAIFNLSTHATTQEIKHAYRRKAKEVHPDVGGSEQAFKALNAAYELALAHAKQNGR